MTGEGVLLRMTGRGGTIVIPTSPLSFRTAVRNLMSPSEDWSITMTIQRSPGILDSSSCAPQNDSEGAHSSQ